MKRICFLFLIFLSLLSCHQSYPLQESDPYFRGTWKSEIFEMKGRYFYFNVFFDPVHNIVNLKRMFIGGQLDSRWNENYKIEKPLKKISFLYNGRVFKFEAVNENVLLIIYNGKKINAYKLPKK